MTAKLAGLAVCLALTSAPAAAVDPARIDRVANAAGFVGVALVGEGNDVAYLKAIGTPAPGFPFTTQSTWRYASITKQLTALIVMQEVASGAIDLDAPVTTYWPDWPAPNAAAITVRMLIRHESGIPDPATSQPDRQGTPEFYRRQGAAAAPATSAAGFCAGPARDRPGNGFHYNNCDYIVLGALLERVTGKRYATLLQERIAAPLGITGLGLFAHDAPAAEQVRGHDGKGTPEPAVNFGSYGAAGSAYGTVDALWRFDRALLQYRLLDRIQSTAMWEGDQRLGYAALGSWSYPATLKGCAEPVRIVERRGAIGGVQGRNFIAPGANVALILFTNRADFDYGEVWQGSGFAHDMLAAALCPE